MNDRSVRRMQLCSQRSLIIYSLQFDLEALLFSLHPETISHLAESLVASSLIVAAISPDLRPPSLAIGVLPVYLLD